MLTGYKTYITIGIAWLCALWQWFAQEPIPGVDPETFAVATTTISLVMRKVTSGPPASVKDIISLAWRVLRLARRKPIASTDCRRDPE